MDWTIFFIYLVQAVIAVIVLSLPVAFGVGLLAGVIRSAQNRQDERREVRTESFETIFEGRRK